MGFGNEDGATSPRRVRSMHRPMRRAYIGNFLDRGLGPREPLGSNAEVARYLMRAALRDLGGEPIVASGPEADEHIARMMAAETVAALNRAGGRNSAAWYTDAIRETLGIAGMLHPELVSDEAAVAAGRGFRTAQDARCVFFAALAITSQNNAVPETTRYAMEQFRTFLATGRFEPRVYGQKGASVAGNLDRFNLLLSEFEGDVEGLRGFLSEPYTMGELRGLAAAHGIRLGGREMLDETVYGSMLFGPKIGNGFYQNLMGNPGPVTVDLWLMRTFGRYTGTLVRGEIGDAQVARLAASLATVPEAMRAEMAERGIDAGADVAAMAHDELVELCRPLCNLWEAVRRRMVREGATNADVSRLKADMGWPGAATVVLKGLSDTVDQPARPSDRRWIRRVAARALEILAERGYRMNAADMQATLWYPERDLYGLLSGRDVQAHNVSYADALAAFARGEGHQDDAIEQAKARGRSDVRHGLAAVVDHRRGGGGGHGPARRRDAGAGHGAGPGDARPGRVAGDEGSAAEGPAGLAEEEPAAPAMG